MKIFQQNMENCGKIVGKCFNWVQNISIENCCCWFSHKFVVKNEATTLSFNWFCFSEKIFDISFEGTNGKMGKCYQVCGKYPCNPVFLGAFQVYNKEHWLLTKINFVERKKERNAGNLQPPPPPTNEAISILTQEKLSK